MKRILEMRVQVDIYIRVSLKCNNNVESHTRYITDQKPESR